VDRIIDQEEDYKEIRNKPGIIIYTKIGSRLNKDTITIKADVDLGSRYMINDIINLLLKVEDRPTWDPTAKEYFMDKRYDDCLLLKRYEIIIPMPFMQNREFVEKQITFRSNGRFYVYSSSVDDSLEPLKPKLMRAKTFLCASRFTQEGDTIKVTMVSQMDMKLFLPSFLLGGKMADELEQFKDCLIKKLEKTLSY